jgi:hypothetical protein
LPRSSSFYRLSKAQREQLIHVYIDFEFHAALELWTPVIARIYAKHYSLSKLEDFSEFYETDLGQRFIKAQNFEHDESGNVKKATLAPTFTEADKTAMREFLTSERGKSLTEKQPDVATEIRETIGKKVKYETDNQQLFGAIMSAIVEIKNLDPATSEPRKKPGPRCCA